MLRWRLLLGILIIGALVALGWLDSQAAIPGTWLIPVAIAFTVLATAEVLSLARAGGRQPLGWAVYVGNLLLILSPWLPLVLPGIGPSSDVSAPPMRAACGLNPWPLAALAIGVLLVFAGELVRYRKQNAVMADIAAAILPLVYVGVMLGFAVELRIRWGIGAMAAWLIAVKMGDTGAYTVGRLVGRHKLAPAISPGKTIEGALGAIAFSCLASWAAFAWLVPRIGMPSGPARSPWGWVLFGLLMAGVGMAGDLAESLLKRDAGCKDSSHWLPGFGGVLDLLDSLLLTAPVAWMCWELGLL